MTLKEILNLKEILRGKTHSQLRKEAEQEYHNYTKPVYFGSKKEPYFEKEFDYGLEIKKISSTFGFIEYVKRSNKILSGEYKISNIGKLEIND